MTMRLLLLSLVATAAAFTPSSRPLTASVVQNLIRSEWRMMPDEPAPEVSVVPRGVDGESELGFLLIVSLFDTD